MDLKLEEQKVALTVQRICSENKIPHEMFRHDLNYEPYYQALFARTVMEMWGSSKEVELEVSVHIPDGWWQAFKKDHFPEWLLRVFPVRTLKVSEKKVYEIAVMFPELGPVMDRHQNIVTFWSRING